MHSRKTVPIPDLMSAANMELIRLDFKSSTLSRHSKEFRSFSNYCRENEITAYDAETGPQYFQHCYGLDIGNSTAKLTKQQLDTRCSIRFWMTSFNLGMHCDTATMTTQCHGNMSIYWKNTLHGATEIIVLMVLSVSSGQRYGNFLLSGWARNRTFRFNRCRNFGLHDHPVPLPSCNYPCIQQRFT